MGLAMKPGGNIFCGIFVIKIKEGGNMKKLILIFPVTLFLAACTGATTRMNNIWTGRNFDEYVVLNGPPDNFFKLQDGGVVYSFKEPCDYTPGYEETSVVVFEDNAIKQISWQTSCPASFELKRMMADAIEDAND